MKSINWYWMFKNVFFGPFLRVWNRPQCSGLDNFPAAGGAVIASNHQSVVDSFYLPLLCPRRITFVAKQEYFTGTGIVGALQRWFFTAVGQVPIDRDNADSARGAIATAASIVEQGDFFGIYPEGTRSPDGRLYRGKTGGARVALATGAPIIPVAMIDTRQANPIGSWIVRPVKVGMKVGAPIDPRAVVEAAGLPLSADDHRSARVLTDEVMRAVQKLSGQDYVDVYAGVAKSAIADGQPLPETTRRAAEA